MEHKWRAKQGKNGNPQKSAAGAIPGQRVRRKARRKNRTRRKKAKQKAHSVLSKRGSRSEVPHAVQLGLVVGRFARCIMAEQRTYGKQSLVLLRFMRLLFTIERGFTFACDDDIVVERIVYPRRELSSPYQRQGSGTA